MAKSSCIPAAWSVMSDLDGQLCLCEPERERHAEWSCEPENRAYKQAEDWEGPRLWLEPAVPREPEVCSGNLLQMDSTRLRGVMENQWGPLAISPTGQLLSGSCRPVPAEWERSLPPHTGLVSVNSAGFCSSWDLKYGPSTLHWPFCQVSHRKSDQHNGTCSEVLFLIFMQMFTQISAMTDKISVQIALPLMLNWVGKKTQNYFSVKHWNSSAINWQRNSHC